MRILPPVIALGLLAGAALAAEFEVRQSDRTFTPDQLSIRPSSAFSGI